jgi:hypothetical protein
VSFGVGLPMKIVTNFFFPFSPGFWSKLKEKGAVAKDAWGVIGSA